MGAIMAIGVASANSILLVISRASGCFRVRRPNRQRVTPAGRGFVPC